MRVRGPDISDEPYLSDNLPTAERWHRTANPESSSGISSQGADLDQALPVRRLVMIMGR